MIAIQDIRVNAQNPSFPLIPLISYLNSDSTIKILGVPKDSGDYHVEYVHINVQYPDGHIESSICARKGGLWIGTVGGSATEGYISNGYQIWAHGTDENGEGAHWCLGSGDVTFQKIDGDIPAGVKSTYVHILESKPDDPQFGMAYFEDGSLRVWTGEDWTSTGITKLSQLENDVGYLTKDEVETDKIINEAKTQYLRYDGKIFIRYMTPSGYGPWSEASQLTTKVYVDNQIEQVEAKIPTRISQLTNDSSFAVRGDIPTKLSQLTNDKDFIQVIPEGARDPSGLNKEIKTSWLTNDMHYITSADINPSTAHSGFAKNADFAYYAQYDLDGNAIKTTYAKKSDLDSHLSAVEGLIPSEASTENQLADKDFVNSSIMTNTAYFKGTYNDISALPTDRVTPNDYAFVIGQDEDGNTTYNRYKFSADGEWLFEYTLNNSSFTAAQWEVINNGATKSYVDDAVSELATYSYVDNQTQDAISEAKSYTDSVASELAGYGYVDSQVEDAIAEAKSYTDNHESTEIYARSGSKDNPVYGDRKIDGDGNIWEYSTGRIWGAYPSQDDPDKDTRKIEVREYQIIDNDFGETKWRYDIIVDGDPNNVPYEILDSRQNATAFMYRVGDAEYVGDAFYEDDGQIWHIIGKTKTDVQILENVKRRYLDSGVTFSGEFEDGSEFSFRVILGGD